MKDAFTTALSEAVQNQIELTSTIEAIMQDALHAGVTKDKVDELRAMTDYFNTRVSLLTQKLASQHDGS